MINHSSWTEFKLDEIFEKISVKKISGKAGDFPAAPGGEYVVPLLITSSTSPSFSPLLPGPPLILSTWRSIFLIWNRTILSNWDDSVSPS